MDDPIIMLSQQLAGVNDRLSRIEHRFDDAAQAGTLALIAGRLGALDEQIARLRSEIVTLDQGCRDDQRRTATAVEALASEVRSLRGSLS